MMEECMEVLTSQFTSNKNKNIFLVTVGERLFMFRFVHSPSVDEGEGLGEDPTVDYGSSQELVAAIWWLTVAVIYLMERPKSIYLLN